MRPLAEQSAPCPQCGARLVWCEPVQMRLLQEIENCGRGCAVRAESIREAEAHARALAAAIRALCDIRGEGSDAARGNAGMCGWLHIKPECGDCGSTEAGARALWAVRVLDAWCARDDARYIVFGLQWSGKSYYCSLRSAAMDKGTFRAPTPDAARIAAAEALLKEDPSLGEGL